MYHASPREPPPQRSSWLKPSDRSIHASTQVHALFKDMWTASTFHCSISWWKGTSAGYSCYIAIFKDKTYGFPSNFPQTNLMMLCLSTTRWSFSTTADAREEVVEEMQQPAGLAWKNFHGSKAIPRMFEIRLKRVLKTIVFFWDSPGWGYDN